MTKILDKPTPKKHTLLRQINTKHGFMCCPKVTKNGPVFILKSKRPLMKSKASMFQPIKLYYHQMAKMMDLYLDIKHDIHSSLKAKREDISHHCQITEYNKKKFIPIRITIVSEAGETEKDLPRIFIRKAWFQRCVEEGKPLEDNQTAYLSPWNDKTKGAWNCCGTVTFELALDENVQKIVHFMDKCLRDIQASKKSRE